MLWREPMAACRFRRNRARRKGFRYDHPSISSLQRRRARPGGSDASMTCSTMDANRSVQDASHVAGQRARRKGGIKRPLTEDRRSGQESLILKTILAAAVLLVAYLAATPADAAEFVRKSAVKGGPDVITITGEILKDDDKKFYEIVYGLKDVSIVVNSKGGRIQAAARIGVYIRQKNWET